MRKCRIGVIGLGHIAMKAYLPILTKEEGWTLVGAFSPGVEKREKICRQYRMNEYSSMASLAADCDAMFVHSSTDTHFEIVSELISKGLDVYVDKPLAATIEQAEQLVELSQKRQRKLMVGFNRRFAPLYQEAKKMAGQTAWIRIDKHRPSGGGTNAFSYTMLDDYLHLVDTARWLGGKESQLLHGRIQLNEHQDLHTAHHLYESKNGTAVFTSMHRQAGTDLEQVEWTAAGQVIRVENMACLQIKSNGHLQEKKPPSWESILTQRGFDGAIRHFIEAVDQDSPLMIDGEEAFKSQLLVQKMIDSYDKATLE